MQEEVFRSSGKWTVVKTNQIICGSLLHKSNSCVLDEPEEKRNLNSYVVSSARLPSCGRPFGVRTQNIWKVSGISLQ